MTTAPMTQRIALGALLSMVGSIGIAHSKCVWPGQRPHQIERGRVRIVTFDAAESSLIAPRDIPIPIGAAVHPALPIAIRRTMALPTQSRHLLE